MKNMTEIRWHGRGGQGVKTACEFFAAVAIREGKYGQGFPEYGPERSGAPMKGFTRISGEAIREHCGVHHPDVVVVLDESLVVSEDVCDGLGRDGTAIINTARPPSAFAGRCAGAVWTVDATKIALEEIGRPIPNMPMIGALARVTGLLDIETIGRNVERDFAAKFGRKTLDGNLRALRRAHDEVKRDG
ncbi:MAG: 2-oxoacid:acceptor oxidoreductase family protein [bacterium]|nr:2-oxoacid:acceptor oxidoreductase family protein [bacterium]